MPCLAAVRLRCRQALCVGCAAVVLSFPQPPPFLSTLLLSPSQQPRIASMVSIDAKVVILGAQGVGKTSFVVRYVRNTFQQGNASTIGASFLAKKVAVDDDAVVRLQIWDTAGQERFRSMAPMYYRSANCGILCYDITSRDSFRAMHSWLIELKENPLVDDDLMIYIVGTKLDLVQEDPSKREVMFEDCVAYAVKHLAKRKKPSASSNHHSQSPRSRRHSPSTSYQNNNNSHNHNTSNNTNSIKNKLAAARSSRNRRHTFSNQNIPSRRNSAMPALGVVGSNDSSTSGITAFPPVSSPRRHRKSEGPVTSLQPTKSLETPEFFTEYTKSKRMIKSKTHQDFSHILNPSNNTNELYDERNDNIYNNDPTTNDHPYPTPLYKDSNDSDDESESDYSESELEFAASCCHEISAKDNRGIEDVFEAITRRLVEHNQQKEYLEMYQGGDESGYYDYGRRGNTVYLHREDEMSVPPKSSSKCC